MKGTALIRSIINQPWLISKADAEALYPLAFKLLFEPKEQDADQAGVLGLEQNDTVAVVPITDVLTKEDGWCNWGTNTLAEHIRALGHDDTVGAIILKIDSPGGASNSVQYISSVIRDVRALKPVVAYTGNGIAASAAYWIASNCDAIISTFPNDAVGSIGVYATVADMSRYYKRLGIDIHEVYASKSGDKGGEIRALFSGNEQPLKARLDQINEEFHAAVKTNRPGIDDEVFTGKMYASEQAKSLGLIDYIMTFDEAIAYTASLANTKKGSTNQNQPMTIKEKWDAIMKWSGLKTGEDLSEEKIGELNTRLGELEAITSERDTAISDRDALRVQLSEKDTEIEALKSKFTPPETPVKSKDDKTGVAAESDFHSAEDDEYKAHWGIK